MKRKSMTVFFGCLLGILSSAGLYQISAQEALIQQNPVASIMTTTMPKVKFDPKNCKPEQSVQPTDEECKIKFLSQLKVSVSLFKTDDNGINMIVVRSSDGAQFFDIPVETDVQDPTGKQTKISTICDRNTHYPDTPDGLCLDLNENLELAVSYRLPGPLDPAKDKYSIIVRVVRTPNATAEIYTTTAKIDFTTQLSDSKIQIDRDFGLKNNENINYFYTASGNQEKANLPLNDRIIRIEIKLPPRPIAGIPESDENAERERQRIEFLKDFSIFSRIAAIKKWITDMENDRTKIKTYLGGIKIEPQIHKLLSPDYEIKGFAYVGQEVSNAYVPKDTCEFPTEARFSKLTDEEKRIAREFRNLSGVEKSIFCEGRFVMYLIGEERFPEEAFFVEYTFPKSSPVEITSLNNTGKGVLISAVSSPPKIESKDIDKTLGLRGFKSNLDVQFNLTSSVADVEEAGVSMRKRKNEGTLDIRFAPFLNQTLYRFRNGNTFNWTPVFLDAKASLNSITKDTLSTNRTLVGTDFSLFLKGAERKATETRLADDDTYKLSFKFINASDRDFKKAEAKFNFETLFYLTALNNPLSSRSKLVTTTLVKDPAITYVPNDDIIGYQIQPIVGFDFGKVYRNKRDPFEIEDQSKLVRRLYFGLDMQFDLTRRFQFSIKDTYYLRWGVTDSFDRNHFIGTFSTPIGTLGRGATQSAFFSFERGNEPPFVGRGVNAFKIGYRINFNFGLDGIVY